MNNLYSDNEKQEMKDLKQVVSNNNKYGTIGVNFKQELNIFDPGDKFTKKPANSLSETFHLINTIKKWDLIQIKNIQDDLWQYKFIVHNDKKLSAEDKKALLDKIKFYIEYLGHQSDYLSFFQSNLLTLIATIFLPLTFVTGFFGMNFKSMGVPSLKKGIFNFKHADKAIGIFSLIVLLVLGWQFNAVYRIFV